MSFEKLRDNMKKLKDNFYKQGELLFKEELNKIFTKYPELNSFGCRVSNHEFNDGEKTYFSLYSEENIYINGFSFNDYADYKENKYIINEGITEEEFGFSKDYPINELIKELECFVESIPEEIAEFLFGDADNSLTFYRDKEIEID